jgi:hypothetical protein
MIGGVELSTANNEQEAASWLFVLWPQQWVWPTLTIAKLSEFHVLVTITTAVVWVLKGWRNCNNYGLKFVARFCNYQNAAL